MYREAAVRVEQRLRRALRDALDLLETHRHDVAAVAAALIERETLCADDVAEIMTNARQQRGWEAAL
jgi:ATP-dependent Zn protease